MLVLSAIAAACTSGVEIKARAEAPVETTAPLTTQPPATIPPTTQPPTTAPVEEVDVEGCDRKTIGEESGPIAVAYAVESGRLAPTPCFGEASDVVIDAWTELAQITPPQLIFGVTILAGFDDSESDTLAFAGPVANDSDEHLIAVGMRSAADDPQELRLTMVHELAHVFTQTNDQINVAFFSNECDTFYNGFGCFEQDAYMTQWIDRFWSATEIETLPRNYSADIEGGDRRCLIDPGFPGSYAASHPEEDFAEAFSAYVFDVEMPPGFDDRISFFDEQPVFVAMRQAIRRTGDPAPPGNFDECG